MLVHHDQRFDQGPFGQGLLAVGIGPIEVTCGQLDQTVSIRTTLPLLESCRKGRICMTSGGYPENITLTAHWV